jgi:anti-sigma regulatory factor (Ser/Thr protein kinase)
VGGYARLVNGSRQTGIAYARIDTRSQLIRTASADASGAAQIRIEFANWLQRHFTLSNERLSDLVLAANEALANAVDFGHFDNFGSGTIALTASYDETTDTLTVTVTDHDTMRPVLATKSTNAPSQYAPHGRGISLMRLLANDVQIVTSERGTQLCLAWTELSTSPYVPPWDR